LLTVKVSTSFPECFNRQTPGGQGIWRDIRFVVNEDVPECDYWVVYEGLADVESTRCPKENVFLITGEPPSSKTYERDFIQQFSLVVTSHADMDHPNILLSQQALPWHIASLNRNSIATKIYDDFVGSTSNKNQILSVITSDLEITEGHRKRKAFVYKLKAHFGDRLDVFGRGIRDIEDKWDAIAPYKYHIVLENSYYENYWSEKLADCFLGDAYPFYYGCPNIDSYFPSGALRKINIDNFDDTVQLIEEAIENDVFRSSQHSRSIAKNLVLNKYNLFELIASFCQHDANRKWKDEVALYPESHFVNTRYDRFKDNLEHAISEGDMDRITDLAGRCSYEYACYLQDLFRQGDYNRIASLTSCEQLSSGEAYFFYGRALKCLNQYEQAASMLQRYLSSVADRYHLAKAQDRINNRDLYVSAHFHIGEILFREQPDQARYYFNKCMELTGNNHKMADQYLKQLS
jgi:Glycosyltransferase family 10 (fucosyltransferase).